MSQRNSIKKHSYALVVLSILLFSLFLAACNSTSSTTTSQTQTKSFTSASGATNQQITYGTGSQDVLLRTFHGGGLYGSLELSPDISIYGDGTYILGTQREGHLSSDALQQLLKTLVNTDGLLSMQRQQFIDVPDQNATFLELSLNGKHQEFEYGPFGSQQESQQDMDEYHRLNQALTSITQSISGPTQPYKGSTFVLLARQMFSPDLTQTLPNWNLTDFTLAQAAVYDCGVIPADTVSINAETGCLKYLRPDHAILLTSNQLQAVQGQMNGQLQGTFTEQSLYYTIILRPLLPDEVVSKQLATFGSSQTNYVAVPILQGAVPPVPTPTPST